MLFIVSFSRLAVVLCSTAKAKYTDPLTKLHFANAEEFSRTRMLPPDIVTGLLGLRRANPELQ